MKKLVLPILAVALIGYSFNVIHRVNDLALSRTDLEAKKATLIGSHPELVIELFGQPSDIMRINGEVKVYCYKNYHARHHPEYPFGFFVTVEGDTIVSLSYEHH
jgi:hypothetical protein